MGFATVEGRINKRSEKIEKDQSTFLGFRPPCTSRRFGGSPFQPAGMPASRKMPLVALESPSKMSQGEPRV